MATKEEQMINKLDSKEFWDSLSINYVAKIFRSAKKEFLYRSYLDGCTTELSGVLRCLDKERDVRTQVEELILNELSKMVSNVLDLTLTENYSWSAKGSTPIADVMWAKRIMWNKTKGVSSDRPVILASPASAVRLITNYKSKYVASGPPSVVSIRNCSVYSVFNVPIIPIFNQPMMENKVFVVGVGAVQVFIDTEFYPPMNAVCAKVVRPGLAIGIEGVNQ